MENVSIYTINIINNHVIIKIIMLVIIIIIITMCQMLGKKASERKSIGFGMNFLKSANTYI